MHELIKFSGGRSQLTKNHFNRSTLLNEFEELKHFSIIELNLDAN